MLEIDSQRDNSESCDYTIETEGGMPDIDQAVEARIGGYYSKIIPKSVGIFSDRPDDPTEPLWLRLQGRLGLEYRRIKEAKPYLTIDQAIDLLKEGGLNVNYSRSAFNVAFYRLDNEMHQRDNRLLSPPGILGYINEPDDSKKRLSWRLQRELGVEIRDIVSQFTSSGTPITYRLVVSELKRRGFSFEYDPTVLAGQLYKFAKKESTEDNQES